MYNVINIINPAKVVERVNPKSSCYEGKYFFFFYFMSV